MFDTKAQIRDTGTTQGQSLDSVDKLMDGAVADRVKGRLTPAANRQLNEALHLLPNPGFNPVVLRLAGVGLEQPGRSGGKGTVKKILPQASGNPRAIESFQPHHGSDGGHHAVEPAGYPGRKLPLPSTVAEKSHGAGEPGVVLYRCDSHFSQLRQSSLQHLALHCPVGVHLEKASPVHRKSRVVPENARRIALLVPNDFPTLRIRCLGADPVLL